MLYYCCATCFQKMKLPSDYPEVRVTICQKCINTLLNVEATVFFDGTEVLLETLDPTPLDQKGGAHDGLPDVSESNDDDF